MIFYSPQIYFPSNVTPPFLLMFIAETVIDCPSFISEIFMNNKILSGVQFKTFLDIVLMELKV